MEAAAFLLLFLSVHPYALRMQARHFSPPHPLTPNHWHLPSGMATCADEVFGNVTAALKAKGMWDDLVLIFTSDNGGERVQRRAAGKRHALGQRPPYPPVSLPIPFLLPLPGPTSKKVSGSCANNYPLRGGKRCVSRHAPTATLESVRAGVGAYSSRSTMYSFTARPGKAVYE